MSTPEPADGQDWALQPAAGPRRAIDDRPVKVKAAPGGPRRGLAEEPPPPSLGRRVFRFLREAVIILVVAVIISTLIRTFGVEQFRVPTGSMEQTLYGDQIVGGQVQQRGDRIFVTKLGGFDRGDIIVFEDKLGWLNSADPAIPWFQAALEFVGVLPDSSKHYLVKRLIGLPGDHVVCCSPDGRITVNGYELQETYLFKMADGSQVNPSDWEFDLVVPKDHVFVLGDHRNDSADSRYHLCAGTQPTPDLAFPAVDDIEGPVVAIAYPFDRMTRFRTPAIYAGVPDPAAAPDQAEVAVYPFC